MIHEFNPVIYPRKVWITYDATPDELNDMFPSGDTNGNKFKVEEGHYGITDRVARGSDNKGGVLLRFESKESMTSWTMAHESIHAAGFICNYVGIQADWANDEAFTYLASWIVKCCEKVKVDGESIYDIPSRDPHIQSQTMATRNIVR